VDSGVQSGRDGRGSRSRGRLETRPDCTTKPAELVERAQTRADRELGAVDAKRDAFESFVGRIRDVPARRPAVGSMPAVGDRKTTEDASSDGCRAVRSAFADTVRPQSVADVDDPESLAATIRSELTDSIAVALASSTDAAFSPALKRAVLVESAERLAEIRACRRALRREREQLADAAALVSDVTTWIVTADETPLGDLGFDELRDRHETLAEHRRRCSAFLGDRQAFLRETTTGRGDVACSHDRFSDYLYGDLDADYPALSAVVQLDGTCRECQRAVRDHLVRRA